MEIHRKGRTHLLHVILVSTFWLLLVPQTAAHTFEDLSEQYEKSVTSVVTIHTYEDKLEKGKTRYASKPNGLGSGVIISDQGLIATASHVVHAVDGLHVEFNSGDKRTARVISTLAWADLALIKVDGIPEGTSVATLTDSDKVKIGQQIYVIGAPLGISKTLTVGYVSGIHPENSHPTPKAAELFQTDAAINPGNSGGPMFNLQGDVIGIASHIKSRSGGSDGLGFAVTSNAVKKWLLEKRPFWSGIMYQPINDDIRKALGLPFQGGVIVQKVNRESNAYKAGLRGGTVETTIADQTFLLGGDIIVSINGTPIINMLASAHIMNALRAKDAATSIDLKIWRKGTMKDIKVALSQPE